jgi:hypothetical protein
LAEAQFDLTGANDLAGWLASKPVEITSAFLGVQQVVGRIKNESSFDFCLIRCNERTLFAGVDG